MKTCVESGCMIKINQCENLIISNFCCYHICSTPNFFWCEKCTKAYEKYAKDLGDIERLPKISCFWEVDPGISNEWDAFWLMGKEGASFFEIAPDYRKKKIIIHIETIKCDKNESPGN